MLDHMNLLRHVAEIIGGMFVLWFCVMFFYFWVCERRKLRR